MSAPAIDEPVESRYQRSWVLIGFIALVCLPGIVLRLAGIHPDPVPGAIVFGFAILAAAFLLSWAAETAEMDISQGLALAIIAIIAVLPEYAVDAVLAWKAGADPAEAEKGLAIANMTGGNRLLIGVGWPIVFLLFFYRTKLKELVVNRQRSLELVFLAVATLYVIFIPLRSHVTIIDTIILVSLFIMYMYFTSKVETEHVELVGPAKAMGQLRDAPRRSLVIAMLVFAAVTIFCSAEPFAESLVHIGEDFGVSEFLLIQWLAPLASESPEVLVACLLAWRGRAAAGMGVLISSKVNQWTLLIGTLPIAFLLSSGDFGFTHGLPLDTRQREEIFLTAAQSAFAIAVFMNLRMGKLEAIGLFVLFATQLFITNEGVRAIYAVLYTVLCVVLLFISRKEIPHTVRDAIAVMRGRDLDPWPRDPGPG
ncbi:MAG: sodium:calcium antiporter [Dehalococcoidia bacterium]|uniref:sodium:calcium antiporter n=1 Tax=Candidatus Amarobacter glycogenicus TaxID=3140699 RepID=UPI003134F1FD|nr:sodium:calcium antiporter [Dehalococcoidia bacterium]MBK7328547.1 sodium:calcium antiporter [Dehalococcoidia bacterium]